MAAVSTRLRAKVLEHARIDVQWYFTERVAALDLGSSGFESGAALVWDEARLGILHERQIDLVPKVERARVIHARLAQLAPDLQVTTRDRWLSWGEAHAVAANAFALNDEPGTYLGIVLTLPAARESLEAARARHRAAPRTVLEMLEGWAKDGRRRAVDDLRREAVRQYGRAIHTYADIVLGR